MTGARLLPFLPYAAGTVGAAAGVVLFAGWRDVAFGLACLTAGAACGWLAGVRRGVALVWLTAVLAYTNSTRAVHLQLARAEAALALAGEVAHARINARFWPDNGPGHRSPAGWDTPPPASPRPSRVRTTPR